MEKYTVIKKGSSIRPCIQIPEEFLDEKLEITIKPYRPKMNISRQLEQLFKKYQDINPFDSVEDPGEWQQRVRHDWKKDFQYQQRR